MKQAGKRSYHHGHLAESLLDAVDDIATRFGLEAVTLRACAKQVGVSPSSAFRHYIDKRALLTAFATRALGQLADALDAARQAAEERGEDVFEAVAIAYIDFALNKPAFFRAMWRQETIYVTDADYVAAAARLRARLQGGFAGAIDDDDPDVLDPAELLLWSAVHGLANLFVDGPIASQATIEDKRERALAMFRLLQPALQG